MSGADPMNERPKTGAASLLERAARHFELTPQARVAAAGPPMMRAGAAPAVDPAPAARIEPKGPSGAIDFEGLRDGGFLVPDMPATGIAEEFRIVKRQLLQGAFDAGRAVAGNGNLILVCSAQPSEGKTFCSINLALSMAAERDLEVLLVDADFAKPAVLSTLGLQGGRGLMDALADPASDVETMIITTDLPGLSVLPAGRHHNDANELLASQRMQGIVAELGRARNRIVIFDSPPALASSAASVLALHVGQVVMVVNADVTRESQLKDALSLLSGCPSIQLLLNRVSFAPGGRRFGAYYGYGG
jgi:protein-tyrosine kinase